MFAALESFTALPCTREINGFKTCITLMFIHVRFYLDVNVYGCNFSNAVLLQQTSSAIGFLYSCLKKLQHQTLKSKQNSGMGQYQCNAVHLQQTNRVNSGEFNGFGQVLVYFRTKERLQHQNRYICATNAMSRYLLINKIQF